MEVVIDSLEKGKGHEYKLYNFDLKKKFIEQYDENSQQNYTRYLSKVFDMEKNLDKDLANFYIGEVEDYLKGLNITTKQSLFTILSIITKYIDFAINKGFVPSKINWAKTISGSEELEKYISKMAQDNAYITRDQLHGIMKYCYNIPDRAIFGLLFEGFSIKDIVHIKEKDIKIDMVNNIATINLNYHLTKIQKDDEGDKKEVVTKSVERNNIKITDERIVAALRDTTGKELYYKNNGDTTSKCPHFKLHETGYLIRTAGRATYGDIMKSQNIYKRMKSLLEKYYRSENKLDTRFLKPTNIWASGQIDYAKKIKRELGIKELTTEHYKQINRRFGYNEALYYNTKRRIKDYV